VIRIALVLILASALGAGLGLIWQSSSFDWGEDEELVSTSQTPEQASD